jgi:hypothetical protein
MQSLDTLCGPLSNLVNTMFNASDKIIGRKDSIDLVPNISNIRPLKIVILNQQMSRLLLIMPNYLPLNPVKIGQLMMSLAKIAKS